MEVLTAFCSAILLSSPAVLGQATKVSEVINLCFHSDAKTVDLSNAAFLNDFCGLPLVIQNPQMVQFVFLAMYVSFDCDRR